MVGKELQGSAARRRLDLARGLRPFARAFAAERGLDAGGTSGVRFDSGCERFKRSVLGLRGVRITWAPRESHAMTERQQDVKDLISGVPGFLSYAAFRDDGGGRTVTVAHDKAGTDESSRRAAEWVKENIDVKVDPPVVTEGDTILHF